MFVKATLPSPYPASSSFTNRDAQPTPLYIHQQPTIKVIQLEEIPPPSPRSRHYTSTISSSSFFSSSCNSSDDVWEEDESVCSSYCSSEGDLAADSDKAPTYDDTYKMRHHLILAWREGFSKGTLVEDADEEDSWTLTTPPSSPISSSLAASLKRKADHESHWESDDNSSSQRSSKRFRPLPTESRQTPSRLPNTPFPQRRLSIHCCPACDATFPTLKSLEQHGKQLGLNDACREAVEYGLES